MTRRTTAARDPSLVYRWLLERAEEEAASSMPRPGIARRLAALSCGSPVDVPVSDLPEWCRGHQPADWWRRAAVTATGTLKFYDDSGHAWAAENGI